ncbi:hypothetical protein FQR65_LT20179 [Abscondita terminalis]|nr:hypothetical protein FQR65_LT20179 [Abscondita terminalis]
MFELSLLCPEDRVETISDALDALDALSVSVEDADAQTEAEQALFGEPGMPPPKDGWQRSRLVALFPTQEAAEGARDLLLPQDFFEGCSVIAVQRVPDQDWVRLTQSQFAPVDITPEFWIVPTWHELPAQARVSIRLDPGLAFGTGTHPTTRMCLRWIARQPAGGLGRTLDYGCGSGILAIGAAKFGAVDIDAVDIDPAAVESTRYNADANAVQVEGGACPMPFRKAYAPYSLALEVADRRDGWILMDRGAARPEPAPSPCVAAGLRRGPPAAAYNRSPDEPSHHAALPVATRSSWLPTNCAFRRVGALAAICHEVFDASRPASPCPRAAVHAPGHCAEVVAATP